MLHYEIMSSTCTQRCCCINFSFLAHKHTWCFDVSPSVALTRTWCHVLKFSFVLAHTCSEKSYRITDVESILRAKTFQLNLTGVIGWSGVKICARKSFYVLARFARWIKSFWCSSFILYWQRKFRLRKPYRRWTSKKVLKLRFGLKLLENDMPVLGLAGCHWREMRNAIPICITRSNGRLRW